jgi:glucose/arabinose dehydrogenase
VWVDYNGDSDSLAVYISPTTDKPAFAVLKTTLELDQIVGDETYFGFAASTGTAFNNAYIESWNVTLDVPDPDPQTYPTGTLVANDLITGLNLPLAVSWSPDGRNMYIAEKGGVVKVSRDGGPVQTVIDISDKVNEHQDRGLIDFELHPDFENNPYIYLLYTVDPPEVYDNIGHTFAGPDGRGNRAGRLIRVTAEVSNDYTTVDPNSEVILLGSASTWDNFNGFTDSTLNFAEPPAGENPDGTYLQDFINSDSRSHTVGSLAFGIDGNLFVSIGDGASFNRTDVRALRVQDVDSLSGKVLRIDPLTGQGLSDNPFYDGDVDSNRSKVYQLGLRNPWRLSVDPNTGRLYIGETGLSNFEELNTGDPGANFGWPFYEGGQGNNLRTPSYQGLPQSKAFYASDEVAVPGMVALAHGPGSDVIVVGAVADDLILGPKYDGDVFYNDFARGIVRHADVAPDGTLLGVNVFTIGSQFVVDIQQGPDNWLYYVNLVYGTVGRWDIV